MRPHEGESVQILLRGAWCGAAGALLLVLGCGCLAEVGGLDEEDEEDDERATRPGRSSTRRATT